MRLGHVLAAYVAHSGQDQKTVAREIGIGPSMLTRYIQGKEPSARAFVKILAWLFK